MFREANLDDHDVLLELYGQLHPDDPELPVHLSRFALEQILGREGMYLFVWEVDAVVLGTTYLNVVPNLTRSASPYGVVENVVVDAAHRGRGVGQQLMRHTLNSAWDLGCYKVMLMTGSRRESTHAFYRTCGMSSGDKVGYVAHRPAEHRPVEHRPG